MSRIFISYKRVDKAKVFKIKDQIESALEEKCWIDLLDIDSKAQYVEVIMNAIDEAEVFLFMYSAAHSQIDDYENDWTIRELNYAKEEKKTIVFINIDDAPLSKWFKFMFPQKQQVDGQSEYAINALVKDLRNWLKVVSPYVIIECMYSDLTITFCDNKKKKTSLFPKGAQDLLHIHESLSNFSKLNNNQRKDYNTILVYPTNYKYLQIRDYTNAINQYGFHVIRCISSVASTILNYVTLKNLTQTEEGNCLVFVKNGYDYNVGLFDIGMGCCTSFGQSTINTVEDIGSFVDKTITNAWEDSISQIICIDINGYDVKFLQKKYNTTLMSFDNTFLREGASVQFGIMDGQKLYDGYVLNDSLEEYVAVVSLGNVIWDIIDGNNNIPCKRTEILTIEQDFQDEILIELVIGKKHGVIYQHNDPLLASINFPIIPPRPKKDVKIELIIDIDANKIIDIIIKDLFTGETTVYKDIVNHPCRFSACNKDCNLRPVIYNEKD